jgi:hypothetical protein
MRPHAISAQMLVRHELMLLRRLGHDRRLASSRLKPLIRSGPHAPQRIAPSAGKPLLRTAS